MRVGCDENSLFEVLKELDSTTNIDSVLNPGQHITVTGVRRNGHIKDWSIKADSKAYKKSLPYAKGVGYTSLEAALSSLDKESDLNETINVLCYFKTDASRTWDNKIVSYWFNISPCIPFDIKDGQPDFQVIKFELKESDYKVMMESRLALYNEFTEDIYPIRTIAFSSIGKLMDCAASFKYMADVPLGSALLIAERLASVKNLKFIYRYRSEHIKPLVAIAGTRYVKYSQLDFFKQALDYVSRNYICHIEKWSVSDELTTMNVVLDGFGEYSIYIQIKTSDIPGTSMSVEAFARFGSGSVKIIKNSSYHWDCFEKNGGVDGLFEGVFEAIKNFELDYEKLSNKTFYYDETCIKDIVKVLGKKRAGRIDKIDSGEYDAKTLFKLVVNSTYCELPVKQAHELTKRYAELLEDMIYEVSEIAV